MQIIHIIPGKANPNTLNGVNKVVDAIASEQVRLGYKTMVVGVANNTQRRHEPIYEYKLYKKSKIPFCYPNGMLQFLLCLRRSKFSQQHRTKSVTHESANLNLAQN